jgi:DNA-binding LacI/PurR family transcriptional regulator
MNKRATLAQVAAYAEVSIATASRCFSNPELLKPETVTLVRHAASALQYKVATENFIGESMYLRCISAYCVIAVQ